MKTRESRSRSISRTRGFSEKSFDSASGKSRSRSRSRSAEEGYRLHIADIAMGVRKSDLEDIFREFGGLREVWMANSPPCFGFAVFKHKANALAALRKTDGMNVQGGRIRVTHALPRTRGYGRRFFNPNMRCYECGNSGHFYRDCPEIYDDYYDSRHDNHRYSSKRYSSKGSHRNRDYDYDRGYSSSSRRKDRSGRRRERHEER